MPPKKIKPIPAAHPNIFVIIAGGGIGGLTMAVLLERAKIPYVVLEKASKWKPLGSAIALSGQVATFLDQLGLYRDIDDRSKAFQTMDIHAMNSSDKSMKHIGTYQNYIDFESTTGYDCNLISRPHLIQVLLDRIPAEKIRLKQRIVAISQDQSKVTVSTSDGSTFVGSLLIGADGTHSTVRQSIYAEMKKNGVPLPPSDEEPINLGMDCILGVTTELALSEFPMVAGKKSEFQVVLVKDRKASIWYIPLGSRKLGWMINQQMSPARKEKVQEFHNGLKNNYNKDLEWGKFEAETMAEEFAHLPMPFGSMTIRDLINRTPNELISKIMLEEKFYETWYYGRVCLLGDACHKVLPFAAVGSANAMLDALSLANLLYDLRSDSLEDITELFESYIGERKEHGRDAVRGSAAASQLFHKNDFLTTLARGVFLNLVPGWAIRKMNEKLLFNRPQCTFVDFLKHTGSAPVIAQQYSVRYTHERATGRRLQQPPPSILTPLVVSSLSGIPSTTLLSDDNLEHQQHLQEKENQQQHQAEVAEWAWPLSHVTHFPPPPPARPLPGIPSSSPSVSPTTPSAMSFKSFESSFYLNSSNGGSVVPLTTSFDYR